MVVTRGDVNVQADVDASGEETVGKDRYDRSQMIQLWSREDVKR
jgi:hypothetical protein